MTHLYTIATTFGPNSLPEFPVFLVYFGRGLLLNMLSLSGYLISFKKIMTDENMQT